MNPRLSPAAWAGAVMLGVFVFLGIFGPLLAPYPVGVEAVDKSPQFLPMSSEHWLGTDENGVDALSQLMHGARSALTLSLIVVISCALIGVTVGVIAGYFRGVVDEIVMRFVDILMAFPGILLNIAIVATVARPGLGMVIAALIANGWVGYARVARGQVLSLRERDYVRRQIKSLSAEGVLSAYILGAMPVGITLFLLATRPDYIMPLFQSLRGLMLVGVAVGLLGMAAFVMSRLVKVEV